MNANPPESPSWKCRLVRGWAALRPSAPESQTGHPADCPACREYFHTVSSLERQLRREARLSLPVPSPGFEDRLARAVRHARVSPPASAPSPRRWWSVGLSAAAATATLVVLLHREVPPSVDPRLNATGELTALLARTDSLRRQWRETLAPSALRLLATEPLEQELSAAQTDARDAWRFLAANFVPSGPQS